MSRTYAVTCRLTTVKIMTVIIDANNGYEARTLAEETITAADFTDGAIDSVKHEVTVDEDVFGHLPDEGDDR